MKERRIFIEKEREKTGAGPHYLVALLRKDVWKGREAVVLRELMTFSNRKFECMERI